MSTHPYWVPVGCVRLLGTYIDAIYDRYQPSWVEVNTRLMDMRWEYMTDWRGLCCEAPLLFWIVYST